jgi:enoyl-CoA hydratase/carnithine racemase
LKAEQVDRVILTGDFHLSTQLVGADTSEFYPALEMVEEGTRIAGTWSQTARRLANDFRISVGCINGKRCLGGMMELMMHCDYVVSDEDAVLGMPEVTLPVVPGMEGCHWPFRKAKSEQWPELLRLLLSGRSRKAKDTVGWLIDAACPAEKMLQTTWKIATGGDHGLPQRRVEANPLHGIPAEVGGLPATDDPETEAARKAILDSITESCGATLAEAITIQARHSAHFMTSSHCRGGQIGADYKRTTLV